MALVNGTLTDFGLDPLTINDPVLLFRASSTGLAGLNLLSRRPVIIVPAENGYFEADLVATSLIAPETTHYTVEIQYRSTETRMRITELLPWKLLVPPEGGALGDLLRVPANPALVWTGTQPPIAPSPGTWWLNPESGQLQELDGDGQTWLYKADLRGPAGYNATGAAEDDAAVALFITSAGSQTRAALDNAFGRVISPRDFGAVGDGVADDTNALRNAGAAAIAAGKPLHLDRTYKTTGGITFDGSINIAGTGTILAAHTTQPILWIKNATRPRIADIALKGTAAARNSSQYGLMVTSSTDMKISGVDITGSAAAGMFLAGIKRGNISRNGVHDNLADGIHITNGCEGLSVSGNNLENTGDDGIAVVSYTADTGPCRNVTVTGNNVKNSKARGITVIGGEEIAIGINTIDGTASSGILTVQDASEFFTTKAINVTITGNNVARAGQVTPRAGNQFGIEIGGGTEGISAVGNKITDSYGYGISTNSPGSLLQANTVTRAGTSGIGLGASNVRALGNVVRAPGRYGILSTAAGLSNITVCDNEVTDPNMLAVAGTDGIQIGGAGVVTNGIVERNTVNDAAVRSERAIEVNMAGGSLRGNVSTGNTFIHAIGGSNIVRDPFLTTTVPTVAWFAAGTVAIKADTNQKFTYTGTAWKSTTLV